MSFQGLNPLEGVKYSASEEFTKQSYTRQATAMKEIKSHQNSIKFDFHDQQDAIERNTSVFSHEREIKE